MMRAVIFDMDGTLLDSMAMWYGLAPSFCKKHNISWSQQLADDLLGMEFPEAADYFIGRFPQLNMTPQGLIAAWNGMIHFSYLNEVLPKPFAIDYMKQLSRRNIPCAIATMTTHALADAVLAHHGITPLVQIVLTPEDVGGIGKDRPDIYLEAARRLGTPANQCVVFEDTLYAMRTASKAGFTVWAVDEPLQQSRREIETTCHRYISSFKELLDDLSE
ncbi:MAG TPA: HAD family phosphatase [Clostridia bacterium]|nr:HAD family phosphatase [Clostridia bacterium]